jgi:hypothetical protein
VSLNPPTAGDAERARRSRLVAAQRHLADNPGLLPRERDAIAAWVHSGGGRPPWELDAETGGHAYPPRPAAKGPRA